MRIPLFFEILCVMFVVTSLRLVSQDPGEPREDDEGPCEDEG